MNWMKFCLVACIALEVLRVINFVRSDKSKIQVIAKRVKEGSDAVSQVMVELLNSKNKQLAEKDKQMAEKDKQINSLLLIAEVFGKNAEKEMKGV